MDRNFESLDVWKEGCGIAIEIYGITNKGEFAKDYGLRDQIRRCSVSIPSNIAEGKERESVRELTRYLYIAKGSAAELKTQLFISYKVGYLSDQKYIYLSEKISRISGMLGSFIRAIKRSKSETCKKGEKCEKGE